LSPCRSQWPRGLRRGSATAPLLGLIVRIPPGALMYVCCECCVLSGRVLCDELITRPGEYYRMWCVWVWSWNLDNEEALAHWGGVCCAMEKKKNLVPLGTQYVRAPRHVTCPPPDISVRQLQLSFEYSHVKARRGRNSKSHFASLLRIDHTESGLPRRAAICARGGMAFELYYVRRHHPRQTEGGLTRRTNLDRGGQRTFVFYRQICRVGSTEWRKNSLKN
jgi:hypothetical protein